MTKYWITIEEPDKDWDQTKQMSFHAESWDEARKTAIAVSQMYESIVRICMSEGYNNQGYYFNIRWYE